MIDFTRPKCGKRVDVEVTKSDADEQEPSDPSAPAAGGRTNC